MQEARRGVLKMLVVARQQNQVRICCSRLSTPLVDDHYDLFLSPVNRMAIFASLQYILINAIDDLFDLREY